MPYNTSLATIARMRRYLDDLRAGQNVTWPSAQPEKLARQIREAMAAGEYHKERFPEYSDLRAYYRMKVRPKFVEAVYLGAQEEIPVTEPKTHVPVEMSFKDVTALTGVIGTAIENAVKATELNFPNVKLMYPEKVILHKWTREDRTGWSFIDQSDLGITLTREPIDPIYVWDPKDEEG